MWLCHVVDLDFIEWASLTDVSGNYGATSVQCEQVTFGAGGSNALSWYRQLFRALRIIGEL